MSIKAFLESGANVQVVVSPLDLREFALDVIESYKASNLDTPKPDKRLKAKEVALMLGKSVNTLWRWEKRGYLKPAGYIGQTPYYLQSQVEGVLNGERYGIQS